MRTSWVFRGITLAVVIAAVGIGWHERSVAAELERRRMALRQQDQQLSELSAERDRLRRALLAHPPTTLRSPPETAPHPTPRAETTPSVPDAFTVGEWTPATTWQNEGRSTPRAALSTLLWAAAGGDVTEVKNSFVFEADAQAKAREWFESLPLENRTLYATPEDLLASATIRNIPPTSAQLSWFHQADAEHAILGVMLASAEPTARAQALSDVPASDRVPPSFEVDSPYRFAVLSLQPFSNGWRIVVPASAIEHLASQLRDSPPPVH